MEKRRSPKAVWCAVGAAWLLLGCGEPRSAPKAGPGAEAELGREIRAIKAAPSKLAGSACGACWSAELACLTTAAAGADHCERAGHAAADCRSGLRRGVAVCVDARTGCEEGLVAGGEESCEYAVPGADALAGTWTGAAVLGGEPVAVAVVLDAGGTGIVTGVWRGLSGGTSFSLDGWDGENLAVRHRGQPLRGRARLTEDVLHLEAPEIGEVVLTREVGGGA